MKEFEEPKECDVSQEVEAPVQHPTCPVSNSESQQSQEAVAEDFGNVEDGSGFIRTVAKCVDQLVAPPPSTSFPGVKGMESKAGFAINLSIPVTQAGTKGPQIQFGLSGEAEKDGAMTKFKCIANFGVAIALEFSAFGQKLEAAIKGKVFGFVETKASTTVEAVSLFFRQIHSFLNSISGSLNAGDLVLDPEQAARIDGMLDQEGESVEAAVGGSVSADASLKGNAKVGGGVEIQGGISTKDEIVKGKKETKNTLKLVVKGASSGVEGKGTFSWDFVDKWGPWNEYKFTGAELEFSYAHELRMAELLKKDIDIAQMSYLQQKIASSLLLMNSLIGSALSKAKSDSGETVKNPGALSSFAYMGIKSSALVGVLAANKSVVGPNRGALAKALGESKSALKFGGKLSLGVGSGISAEGFAELEDSLRVALPINNQNYVEFVKGTKAIIGARATKK